jgi:RND superfamily putative drug exporter
VTLLGDRAWWLPGWLDRLLPDVSLEGHAEPEPGVRERERERPVEEPTPA